MTHYDHATAMAFKLDCWSEERAPRNFELEALDSQQRMVAMSIKRPPILMRIVSIFRVQSVSEASDKSKIRDR